MSTTAWVILGLGETTIASTGYLVGYYMASSGGHPFWPRWRDRRWRRR